VAAIPTELFEEQIVEGHRVTFGTYKLGASAGGTLRMPSVGSHVVAANILVYWSCGQNICRRFAVHERRQCRACVGCPHVAVPL